MRYHSYRIDEAGISRIWRRKYAITWDKVGEIFTEFNEGDYGKQYITHIIPTEGHRVRLKCLKGVGYFANLPKFSRILKFIVGKVPEAMVCDKTILVAEWGQKIKQTKAQERALKGKHGSIDSLKSLAYLQMVSLNYRRARKLFKQVLSINPSDIDALEAMAEMDFDEEKDVADVSAQYERLLQMAPQNKEYLKMLSALYLGGDNPHGVEHANRLIKIDPEDVEIRVILASYYFRNEMLTAAKETYREIGKIQGKDDWNQFSQDGLDYIEQYECDPALRRKVKRNRKLRTVWWYIKHVVLPLVAVLAFIYKIVRVILKHYYPAP